MKYRYLIINKDGSIEGTNSIDDDDELLKEQFAEGVIDIIDCLYHEQLTDLNYLEWIYIPERKKQ